MRGICSALALMVVVLFVSNLESCIIESGAECGDGKAEGDEVCDGLDLGGHTCQDLGHHGGQLLCTAQCSFYEGMCHDCGEVDPCEGRTCSWHGTCNIENCEPYCQCDEGYMEGEDLTCQATGTCKRYGEPCINHLQCCHGMCFDDPDMGKICARPDCVRDEQCQWFGQGDHTACCIELPYDFMSLSQGDTTCSWNYPGAACGTREGGCGADCTQGITTDCRPGFTCLNWGLEDPYSYCSPLCQTDADCSGCAWGAFPNTNFHCLPIFNGQKACQAKISCRNTCECPADMICSPALLGGSQAEGVCTLTGDIPTGGSCDPFGQQGAWDEACRSHYCDSYHCSQWCSRDCDCPEEMTCGRFEHSYGMTICQWSPGSGDTCHNDCDCPKDETCVPLVDMDGRTNYRCRTQECDPDGENCQDRGDSCGAEMPPCYNATCLRFEGERFCWSPCRVSANCPAGMACFEKGRLGFSEGGCWPFDGSATPCQRDGDCQPNEVCTYHQGPMGQENLCARPEGCGEVGELCLEDSDCRSNICLNHPAPAFCSTVCRENGDCPGYMVCNPLSLLCNRPCTP